MPADKFLPAIGHATSGALGTAISTTTTYPLDLVNTRLKVQRQLRKDGAISPREEYRGVLDAFRRIHSHEGGLKAFYAGLGSDVAKSIVDSFLFFLFYTWFRSRRSRGNSRRLPVWEELAVGAAAGAAARLFTTPISNVVTRKQTASLVVPTADDGSSSSSSSSSPLPPSPVRRHDPSFAEVLHAIRAEKGFLGLWSGYGATLMLTLNPSITFYLQHALKKALVERDQNGESGGMVFLVAALSKVVATSVTYPFNIAKARVQVSVPDSPALEEYEAVSKDEGQGAGAGGHRRSSSSAKAISRRLHRLAQENIFATILRIAKTEGVSALYDGLSGEILKAFFNHGTTMLSKDIAHGLIVRLYFFTLEYVQKSPTAQALLSGRLRTDGNASKTAGSQIAGKYGEIKDGVMRGALVLGLVEWYQKRIVATR